MNPLLEMIRNKKDFPDDLEVTTADGRKHKLSDVRSAFREEETRISAEGAKIKGEWNRVQQAQEEAHTLYARLQDLQGQLTAAAQRQPVAQAAATDELGDYEKDQVWSPVIKKIRTLEASLANVQRSLLDSVNRLNQSVNSAMGLAWNEHYRREYDMNKADLGDLSLKDAIAEASRGNYLDLEFKVPSIASLAAERKKQAASAKASEAEYERGLREGERKERTTALAGVGSPGSNVRTPATFRQKSPNIKIDRRNPFGDAVTQALQDPALTGTTVQ